jgi:hypothetical protein
MKPKPGQLSIRLEKIRVRRQSEFHPGDSHKPCLLKTLAEFASAAGEKRKNCTEISADSGHSEGFDGEKGTENCETRAKSHALKTLPITLCGSRLWREIFAKGIKLVDTHVRLWYRFQYGRH